MLPQWFYSLLLRGASVKDIDEHILALAEGVVALQLGEYKEIEDCTIERLHDCTIARFRIEEVQVVEGERISAFLPRT